MTNRLEILWSWLPFSFVEVCLRATACSRSFTNITMWVNNTISIGMYTPIMSVVIKAINQFTLRSGTHTLVDTGVSFLNISRFPIVAFEAANTCKIRENVTIRRVREIMYFVLNFGLKGVKIALKLGNSHTRFIHLHNYTFEMIRSSLYSRSIDALEYPLIFVAIFL